MQDGKFHPHTEYKKGMRKSRDQQAKTTGVLVRMKRIKIHGKEVKKWVAFSPASSDAQWWTSDKLNDLKWIIQDETTTEHTPIKRGGYGKFTYGSLDIYDITKHPKLLEQMKEWEEY